MYVDASDTAQRRAQAPSPPRTQDVHAPTSRRPAASAKTRLANDLEMRKTQRGGLKEEGTWWRLPPHLHRTLERRRRWRRWRNRSPNDFLHHEKKRLRWATIGMGVYVKPRSIRTHILLAPSRTPPVRRPARPPPDGSGASEAYGRSARGGADLAYSNLGLTETGGRVGTKWRLRTIFTLLAGTFSEKHQVAKFDPIGKSFLTVISC